MARKPTQDRRTFIKLVGTTGVTGMAGLAGCTGGGGGGDGGDGGDGGGGGGGGDGGGDGGADTPEAQQTTAKSGTGETDALTVGLLTPLSGPIGPSGKEHLRAVEMGIEAINADGGANGHEIELVTKDSKAVPDTAVKRARQLIQQEDVDIITGVISSAVAKAVNQFTASQDVPLVTLAAQTPDITKKECRRTTFRITTNIFHQQRVTATAADRMVPEDATRVAAVEPDYVFGHQSWEIFQDAFSERRSGAEYVSETFPAFQKGDYKKEIQKTLDADPDIVHSSLYSGDMIAFIKQAKQFDFFDEVDHFLMGAPIAVVLALGSRMVNAIAFAPAYFTFPDNERTRSFSMEYVDRHGRIPDFFSYYARGGLTAIRRAVERSGGLTTDDFVSGFEGLTFESVLPTTTIRAADHQGIPEAVPAGRLGPIDNNPLDKEIYGFAELDPVRAKEYEDETSCSF